MPRVQFAHVSARVCGGGKRDGLQRSCDSRCPPPGDWLRSSQLTLHMEMSDRGLITLGSLPVLCAAAAAFTHESERRHPVRRKLLKEGPPSGLPVWVRNFFRFRAGSADLPRVH